MCAGQESVRGLYDELVAAGVAAHLIGGADVAAELDAKRAIEQGTRVAAASHPPVTPCNLGPARGQRSVTWAPLGSTA